MRHVVLLNVVVAGEKLVTQVDHIHAKELLLLRTAANIHLSCSLVKSIKMCRWG